MSYLQSSQNFVRALKAQNDPPHEDGPSKIEIAQEAWTMASFNVQNKAEAIVEFILTKMLKDKAKTTNSPVADRRYWDLLSSVLSAPSLSSSSAKAWLLPLLNRVPLVPICTALLDRLSGPNMQPAHGLPNPASQAISSLWPLASPKFTADALLDCFGALLSAATTVPNKSGGLSKIGTLVSTSLQEAFSNSSNKKKLQQAFVQVHLQRWVTCVALLEEEGESEPTLLTDLYHTGRDILFNADTLKTLSEPSSLKALFASLPVTEASLQALSELLRSFALAARKYKALFGQGTSAPAAARVAAMVFFAQCADYIRGAPSELSGAAHSARLDLLLVIEEESLLGSGQIDGQQAIRKEVDACISALPLGDTLTIDAAHLLDTLCVVSRVDHDLIEPQLPGLLPRLLAIPPAPHPAAASTSKLLKLIISNHSRARSLPGLLEQVQAVFTSQISTEGYIRKMYTRAAGSPLLAHDFLSAFAKGVQTFITPGQVLSTAQALVTSLEGAHEAFTLLAARFAAEDGVGSRKKVKKSRTSTGGRATSDATDVDGAAVSFALLARVAAYILPALPIKTVTADVQVEVRTCIHRVDFLKNGPLRRETHEGDDRRIDSWAVDVMLTAALRLTYTLQAIPRFQFPQLQPEHRARLIDMHQHSSVLPELFLELSRYLLKMATYDGSGESTILFDRILALLKQNLRIAQAWNGRSAELAYGDEGASQAATGLFELVLDRFIHIFDSIASQAQLDRIVELLFRAAASSHGVADALTPAMVAQDCLRSALLWEQRRLRASLLSSVTTRLQGVDTVHVETVVNAAPHTLSLSSTGLQHDALDRVLDGFHLLLYCPAEYLPKTSKTDILRRAVVLDMTLTAVNLTADRMRFALKVIRTFLGRIFNALGSAEHQYVQAYLASLVRSVGADGVDDETTLQIVDAHVRTVFRAAQRGSVEAASALIATLLPLRPKQSSCDIDMRMDALRERLMLVLTQDFTPGSIPAELKSALCTFQERISARIETFADNLASSDGAPQQGSVIMMASAQLSFSSWLGVKLSATPLKAADLVRALVTSQTGRTQYRLLSQKLGESVFRLLVAEFEYKAEAPGDLLEQIPASYIALSTVDGTTDCTNLDSLVAGLARRLSVEDFTEALDLITELLHDEQDTHRLACAAHLGSVLLLGAPEGTLKTAQAFFTRSLNTFIDYPQYTLYPPLRAQVLDLVDRQCCERPASLRLVNLTTILPLLARNLIGAVTRDIEASPSTFHKIISIVGALVRLRRDLVANTLPHLCIVLRMLISCLRGPRPNLGGKQRNIVAGSLPAWIHPDHPLGAEEGRALARLMTTLATKTVTRVHAGTSESQKADSLSRPLSKHVTYVLQAYVGAVNDPLCVVPLAVRQELMPGLFVLCDMLNEHDRDALMVSGLDAAGKATLKALWRDYEKQRYVGKG